jgi:hypothetical protein
VVPADYPELAGLCWDRDPRKPISGAEALSLYERNWRHVDRTSLTPEETELIQELTRAYGNGVLLVP